MKPNQDIQQLILLCRANLPHRDAQIANEEDREGGIYELNMNYRCNPLKRIK